MLHSPARPCRTLSRRAAKHHLQALLAWHWGRWHGLHGCVRVLWSAGTRSSRGRVRGHWMRLTKFTQPVPARAKMNPHPPASIRAAAAQQRIAAVFGLWTLRPLQTMPAPGKPMPETARPAPRVRMTPKAGASGVGASGRRRRVAGRGNGVGRRRGQRPRSRSATRSVRPSALSLCSRAATCSRASSGTARSMTTVARMPSLR